jgi:ribonuclease BN (tRNA processing enzyme)
MAHRSPTEATVFEVIVLGVGDCFSAQHHTSALLLVSGGFFLAIDCPDGYRRILKDVASRNGRALNISDINHVLITHIHGDHMNGLEGLALYKHFVENKRLRLAVTPEVKSAIWGQRLQASMSTVWHDGRFSDMKFEDYFDVLPIQWDGEAIIGPFSIRVRRTIHHIPTTALLVQAEGRSFGYSSDTAFDPDLIRFLEPADLIFHEANHGPPHTPYAELAKLPESLRRKMRLIHYPDGFEKTAVAIEPLHEGAILTV